MSTYHHGDLRQAVLRAAGKILEKEGVEALSVRRIARLARVSHNAPYRHFTDREALLAALAAEGIEMLAKAQAETGSLLAMGEAYVRFALEHRQRFQLMFGRRSGGSGLQHLENALSERTGDAKGARDASIAAWSLVHGLAQLMLGGRISAQARQGRDDAAFVRDVLTAVRFVARAAQPA